MISATFGHTNKGVQVLANHGSLHAEFHYSSTPEDIDRLCLQNLRCPDSLVVKNSLKESKDKLHRQSWEWIFETPQYQSWKNGPDISLLLIKGGAGRGKTMMAIGLAEELSSARENTVAYSFCQDANQELNTLESVLKSLILGLVNQHSVLKESLRRRWDTKNDQFTENCTSWRNLWNILFEMLMHLCKYSNVYLILDAIDECRDSDIANFLRLVVRTGLDQPTKLKWLMTSRPSESTEGVLLTGHGQIQVSLELNSIHVSQAVEGYISHKLNELGTVQRYTGSLKEDLRTELSARSEATFLWVSLVCKQLENTPKEHALSTIQNSPLGLNALYDQAMDKLRDAEKENAERCMRLLEVMMLAIRPLNVAEVPIVTGLAEAEDSIESLVNRCTSFLMIRSNTVRFVHQSARDYLSKKNVQAMIKVHSRFGHRGILGSCLSHLSERLMANPLDLPHAVPKKIQRKMIQQKNIKISSLAYATIFWVHHLENVEQNSADQNATDQNATIEEVSKFLQMKLLEWLECLSLLDRLPSAFEALRRLAHIVKVDPTTSAFVQDAITFLFRHYHTVKHWPLQIYSSAIIFSPKSSIVRNTNLSRVPKYLRQIPSMEDNWPSLVQTLEGHTGTVKAVAFSPDGNRIASGSEDSTVRIWDHSTGALEMTLKGHGCTVRAVAFSSDGKQIASASEDFTIKIWNSSTGALERTIQQVHRAPAKAISFSPDGRCIASGAGFPDCRVKLWNSSTGALEMTLGELDRTSYVKYAKSVLNNQSSVQAIAFSPDGRRVAMGSKDKTIKIWSSTGVLEATLIDHSDWVNTVAFSPNGKRIASGSDDKTVKTWDSSGALEMTLAGHTRRVKTVAFCPNGERIISVSADLTVKIWHSTGALEMSLEAYTNWIDTATFSFDGTRIASTTSHHIQIWRILTSVEKSFKENSNQIRSLEGSSTNAHVQWQAPSWLSDTKVPSPLLQFAIVNWERGMENNRHCIAETPMQFSPDGKQIACGHSGETVELWEITTETPQRILKAHSDVVTALVYSPDGSRIASGSTTHLGEATVIIWDAATGNPQIFLREKHMIRVACLEFSPNGKMIACGNGKGNRHTNTEMKIVLWELAACNTRREFKGHSDSVRALAFTPDGSYIASSSDDSTIRLWNIADPPEKSETLAIRLRSRFNPQRPKKVDTALLVDGINFSTDGLYLKTSIGNITVQDLLDEKLDAMSRSDCLPELYVKGQWIGYGDTPFLRIPGDCEPVGSAVRCDKLALKSRGGRVLVIDIDQHHLHSILERAPNLAAPTVCS